MVYLTQSCEVYAVPHEIMNVPIVNVHKLLLTDPPTY